MRFKLTDDAEKLAAASPKLCVDDEADLKRLADISGLGRPLTASEVQVQTREMLVALAAKIGCERATVWLVQRGGAGGTSEERLWNVASTQLGNSIISIKTSSGLAGAAATTMKDVLSNDAQSDSRFTQKVDKATSFVTKSVLCVVVTEPDPDDGSKSRAVGVIQLINKKEGEEDGKFEDADADVVRESEQMKNVLEICKGVAMHQLLNTKPAADKVEA